ncbi:MAG: ABC transporter permease [Steroidobacteraceae bacterium]
MKFLPLVWSDFVRNRARLTFTLIAVVSAFALFGMLAAIGDLFLGANRFSTNDRVFIQSKLQDSLPFGYVARISALKGVRFSRADYGVSTGAYYQDQRNWLGPVAVNMFFSYAVDPSGRFVWDPEQFKQYEADRTGVLVNEALVRQYGWKLGDVIPITMPGTPRVDGTTVWPMTVRGIFRYHNPAENPRQILWHYEYLEEGRTKERGSVGFIVAMLDPGVDPAQVAGKVDELFMNSANETESGTQDSLRRDYYKRIGNITLIADLILTAVFASMMLVTGSSLLQNFAERTREFGVLKALGYPSTRITALVVLESTLLMVLGGTIGLGIAWGLVQLGGRQWGGLRLSPDQLLLGVALMALSGVVTGVIPALRAHRLQVVDALQSARR